MSTSQTHRNVEQIVNVVFIGIGVAGLMWITGLWPSGQQSVEDKKSAFVITSAQRTQCRLSIQAAMHNPNSFRWEGSMSDMRRTGVLKFSGTNAFGGRVQQTYVCQ